MSRIAKALIALVITFAAAGCATPADAPQQTIAAPLPAQFTEQDAIEVANAFFDLLIAGDFEGATSVFDDPMLTALPESKLRATWESLVAQVGSYQERQGTQSVENVDQYKRIVITLRFEKATLDMRVVIDTETGLVSGLFFAPSQAAQPYETPGYVDANAFHEQEVTVGDGDWLLPGALTLPNGEGPFPAVVLVHGSGPNDRDETIGPIKPFRDLAWGLASRGIAVLRYDKRTRVYSDKLAKDANGLTVKEETIDDALAAVRLLQRTDGIDPDRVYVLGHSLGGMLAPRIAQADPQIAGLIIMAGPTRPLEDLFVEQSRYIVSLGGQPSLQENQQLQAIEQQAAAIKALSASEANATDKLLLGAPAQYWIDLQDYYPPTLAGALPQPMLILQGERDYQVTMADFKGWQDALSSRPDVTLKPYAELNHLFIEGAGKSTPDEYEEPGHVAAEVIGDIANWIAAQP